MGMKPRRPRAEPASTCKRPDRDCAVLVCGHPLPCPWHGVVIELASTRISIPAATEIQDHTLGRLRQIARALRRANWFDEAAHLDPAPAKDGDE